MIDMTTDKPIGAELRAALLPAAEQLLGEDAPLGDRVSQLLELLTEERERLSAENERLREENENLKTSLLCFVDRRFRN
jgi:hypothetical protein